VSDAKKALSSEQRDELLNTLKTRFEKHAGRHKGVNWVDVQAKLQASPAKLWSVNEMERTGGEPDVIAYDKKTGEYIFCDCSSETPKDRRNTAYDRAGQDVRAKEGLDFVRNAVDMADAMGIELLTEEQYRDLQKLGKFDAKSSSWLKTPDAVRKLGGAIFGDRRYDAVFIYHNGAQSFYAGRGFRGSLRV